MRTPTTTRPYGYLAGAALVVVVFVGVYLWFVRSGAGQAMDQLAWDGAAFGQRSVGPITLRLLDLVPVVSVGLGLVLTMLITAVRRNWRTLAVAIGAGGAAAVSAQLLKYAVLSRPDLGVDGYAANSFPSGHTTVAAASALMVFLVAGPRLRPLAAVGGTLFAVAAGVSTLANQWHRPSDVVAALLVVAFWGCVAGTVLAAWETNLAGSDSRPRTSAARSTWRITALFVGMTGVAFLVTALRATGDSPGLLVAYLGGIMAIAATGLLIALAATRLFSRLP